MRGDLLCKKKCVHIKLSKEVHAALRSKLFEQGVSMQEVFDEFACRIAQADHSAIKIVERLAERKLQESLLSLEDRKKLKDESLGELDRETLYDLIGRDMLQDESRT